MGNLVGYARISSIDQNPHRQVEALTDAGCLEVFTDHATGSLDPRPELDKVMDRLAAGDTLVVLRLDRPGRSLRHILGLVDQLAERGIGLKTIQDGIDSNAAGGRMAMTVFAALSEFERDLIRERTSAGLAAARARGRTGGRPSLLTEEQAAKARELYAGNDMTVAEIGRALGVSRTTVYRALEQEYGDHAVAARRPARKSTQPEAPTTV